MPTRNYIARQSSFFSRNDPRLHYGLGSARAVDVDIFWPSGLQENFKHLPANQVVTIKESVARVPNRGCPDKLNVY